MKLDIAINYVCYWLLFAVSTLRQALKECDTLDFSVFAAISLAVVFKRRKVDYVKNSITSSSILCSMKDLYRENKLIRSLKILKLKTLASDCVIKKDVTTMPLLIYYDELYMLHPLISALILET